MADPATLETDADVVALAELAALLDDDAAVGEVFEDSSFEQATAPPTAIVAAPMAINNSCFTDFSFALRSALRGRVKQYDRITRGCLAGLTTDIRVMIAGWRVVCPSALLR
jgi:hypothetical protein